MSTKTLTNNETIYASGDMPYTDFQYEEFEGFLACYYLTYLHFNKSDNGNKIVKFKDLCDILTLFAKRHHVQIPPDAIKNVRAKEEWGKPHKFKSYVSVKNSFHAFRTDFGLSKNKEDQPDIRALWELINESWFIF